MSLRNTQGEVLFPYAPDFRAGSFSYNFAVKVKETYFKNENLGNSIAKDLSFKKLISVRAFHRLNVN